MVFLTKTNGSVDKTGYALFSLLLIAFVACLAPFAQAQKAAAIQPVPKLNLHAVKAQSILVQNPITGTGTIFAHKTSKIGPLVEGQIVRVHVKVGDRVNKGDPLFEIRPDSYRFAHEETRAKLAMAEARLLAAKPAYERTRKLYRSNHTSLANLDTARSALDVVRAEITSAKVAVASAKRDLDDTIAYAPFKSVVTFRYMDEGIFLSNRVPGGSSSIVEIKKIDIITAIIQVPARELENIRVGAPVKLMIDGISKPVAAKVTIINDKVDVATRTVEIRMTLQNNKYAIKPGLFVRAEIMPKSRKTIVLPRHVVQGSISGRYVYVLEGGKAVRRNVRTNDHDAMRVEVISGLRSGERVLNGPDLSRISDGMKVGELKDVAG